MAKIKRREKKEIRRRKEEEIQKVKDDGDKAGNKWIGNIGPERGGNEVREISHEIGHSKFP